MTLKELSKQLGVSPSVISRVLNGYTRNFSVSDELRKRILDYVAKTGYRANPVFRSLKKSNTTQIAILFYSRSICGTGYTVEIMTDRASRFFDDKKYDVTFTFNQSNTASNVIFTPPWKCAGYLIPDCSNVDALASVRSSGLPYVVMNGIAAEDGTAVQVDEDDGVAAIMAHLNALGHRKIAFAKADCDFQQNPYDISYIRMSGFMKYARQYGIEPTLFLLNRGIGQCEFIGARIKHCDDSPEFTYESFDFVPALIRSGVTAVISDSYFGMPLLNACHNAGIRVPQDLSVVCYNDLPYMKYAIPPVTTFRIPAEEMGVTAAQILYDKITRGKDYRNGETILLKGNLINRNTTGPANC